MLIVVTPFCPNLQGWKRHYYIFHILQIVFRFWCCVMHIHSPVYHVLIMAFHASCDTAILHMYLETGRKLWQYENSAFTMPWQQTGQCWCFQTLQCKVILEQLRKNYMPSSLPLPSSNKNKYEHQLLIASLNVWWVRVWYHDHLQVN